jgi:hypothetical protein
MWEVSWSKEGVLAVAVAGPRQIGTCSPLAMEGRYRGWQVTSEVSLLPTLTKTVNPNELEYSLFREKLLPKQIVPVIYTLLVISHTGCECDYYPRKAGLLSTLNITLTNNECVMVNQDRTFILV